MLPTNPLSAMFDAVRHAVDPSVLAAFMAAALTVVALALAYVVVRLAVG